MAKKTQKSLFASIEVDNMIKKTLTRGLEYTYKEILQKVTGLAKGSKGKSFKRIQFTKEFGKQFDRLVEEEKIQKHWDKISGAITYSVPMTKEEEEKVEMLLIAQEVLKTS